MKKTLSVLIAILIILGGFTAEAAADVFSLLDGAAEYVYANAESPAFGSVGGEWAVFSLARCGRDIPETYLSSYLERLSKTVKSKNGVLHDRKYTEYSRTVLALTALGADAQSFAGYDLVSPLTDFEKTVLQGVNGAVWALIALGSANFGSDAIRNDYINYILSAELPSGGFSLGSQSDTPDIDVTAMALTSLAPYRDREDVKGAISRGLSYLSDVQTSRGGFESFGSENAESAAQVLLAISELGIPFTDSRFVKNGNTVLDFLILFQKGGGFSHLENDTAPNLMTTEQCLYALAATERLLLGKASVFDMSDSLGIQKRGKLDDISVSVIKYKGKSFDDIKEYKNRNAVEALAERGIISGMTENMFVPDGTMTRAEFATITVKALSLPLKTTTFFDDVNTSDWFYPFVGTAQSYKIVNGVSQNAFNPYGTITREEAAAMLTRAAALCGLDTDMSLLNPIDFLAEFPDYTLVSDWAVGSVAYCCKEKILDTSVIEIKPLEAITRGEIAEMIYLLLGKAELI